MDHVRGVHIDGSLCEALATAGTLKFSHNILAGNSTGKVTEVNAGSTFDITGWFSANSNDSLASTTGILTTPYNYTAPDYRPAVASPALTGSDFTDATFTGLVLGIEYAETSLGSISLYPNPSTEEADINIVLKETNMISVNVFDITGKLVLNAFNGNMSAGENVIRINTAALNAGIYFTSIVSDSGSKTLKMIVTK